MLVNFLYYFLSFSLTLVLINFIIKNAKKISLIDIPNERSSHSKIMPRGAGIAIFLSFIISISIYNIHFILENILFFLSLFIIFLTGLYDDIKNISAKYKMLIISLAVTLLFFTQDIKIDTLGSWFGYDINLPIIISLIFTIFSVAGFTNALNLIDGLDGLAGSISLIILSSYLYLGINYHCHFITIISSFMIVNLIAFLLFNWHPAKIFMGDSGSLILGFTISILSIKLISYISITAILFLAALPILDTIMVMTRRIKNSKPIYSPDKTHIHHILLNKKTKVDTTVMLLIMIQMNFSLLGILLSHSANYLILALFLASLFIFFKYFKPQTN